LIEIATMGKCLFKEVWQADPRFSEWLVKGANESCAKFA
jgi:hypothetical protein